MRGGGRCSAERSSEAEGSSGQGPPGQKGAERRRCRDQAERRGWEPGTWRAPPASPQAARCGAICSVALPLSPSALLVPRLLRKGSRRGRGRGLAPAPSWPARLGESEVQLGLALCYRPPAAGCQGAAPSSPGLAIALLGGWRVPIPGQVSAPRPTTRKTCPAPRAPRSAAARPGAGRREEGALQRARRQVSERERVPSGVTHTLTHSIHTALGDRCANIWGRRWPPSLHDPCRS